MELTTRAALRASFDDNSERGVVNAEDEDVRHLQRLAETSLANLASTSTSTGSSSNSGVRRMVLDGDDSLRLISGAPPRAVHLRRNLASVCVPLRDCIFDILTCIMWLGAIQTESSTSGRYAGRI